MMKIHPEGTTIVSISVIAAIILIALVSLSSNLFIFITLSIVILLLLILIFRFFRIPKRKLIVDESSITAPADGIVVALEEVYEDEYFKENMIQVSIFMSIHDVHINWFPVSGSITYYNYHPGKYLLARHPKSSELNERTSIVIKNKKTEILVRQIAGYVARRIICYASHGKEIEQSDELGFIRFGSRVDVLLPPGSDLNVKIGDRTTGGVTSLAKVK